MIKYSIVMPYYNRRGQLKETLDTFKMYYGLRKDIEVILVESYLTTTEEDQEVDRLLDYSYLRYSIKRCSTITRNPCVAFNLGANDRYGGKYIILTNPECLHTMDILSKLDAMDLDSNYVVCGCQTPKGGWYQHSVHRPACFHFCSCISRENYLKIGGFDENYQYGIGYDDDDFLWTVRNNNIPVIQRDDLIVLHQNHSRDYQATPLVYVNRAYFNKKWGQHKDE